MAEVSIRGVGKRFGAQPVLHSVDLEIGDREFIVLVGPSGCGKSTLLRLIAGLDDASSGDILIGGRVVNRVPPKDRNVAMVFQNYALYPHMTVARNIGFALRAARLPTGEINQRVAQAAQLLGLTDLLQRRPGELSGGQRQRVAMGRAIVRNPAVFLFDEPLSNLDAKLRATMRTEIKKLHQSVPTTIVYVTHDQVEAMTLADRIVIMRDGRIEQTGTPLDLFQRPVNMFVAGFIGSPSMNLVPATVVQTETGFAGQWAGGTLPLPDALSRQLRTGQPITIGLRPEHLTVATVSDAEAEWRLEGVVTVVEPLGTETLVLARFGEHEMMGKAGGTAIPRPGETLPFTIDVAQMHVFEPDSGMALMPEVDATPDSRPVR